MDIVEHLIERARSRPRTVVLPEGEDPRILQAARRLHDGGIARPMLIGERAALEAAAAAAGVSIDTSAEEIADECAKEFMQSVLPTRSRNHARFFRTRNRDADGPEEIRIRTVFARLLQKPKDPLLPPIKPRAGSE